VRERQSDKAARALLLFEKLGELHPEAATELEFDGPIQLLVAVVLSAQCTDVRVNLVTPKLFARFPTVQAFAAAKPRQVMPFIRTCGLFRNKARAIVAASRQIVAGGGQVPTQRHALAALPGIGNKSAGVIAMHLSDAEPALPVDTHVARLAWRMGLSSSKKPDQVEADLKKLLPVEAWKPAHHQLIWHGRRICKARGPACDACPASPLCPKRGAKPRPVPVPAE